MGLFDKIKSIFTSEEQEKKSDEQDTPTEVSESDDATDDSDLETIETIDQEKVEEPLSKEEVKSLEDEMAVTSDETVKQVDKQELRIFIHLKNPTLQKLPMNHNEKLKHLAKWKHQLEQRLSNIKKA